MHIWYVCVFFFQKKKQTNYLLYYSIGIALYNNVRQAYGLTKKQSCANITSVKEVQDYLQQLYPNGTDQLDAFVGAMAEDHLPGSNFGELIQASIITQVNIITTTVTI